jgi:hypothetical protein
MTQVSAMAVQRAVAAQVFLSSSTVAAMPRRSRFRPCAITLPRDRIAADIDTLPLWTWFRNRPALPNRGGRARHGNPIIKHCVTCGCVINRTARRQCRPCSHIGLKREVPDDFRSVLFNLGSHGAAKHYHASLSTVTRWRREMGITPLTKTKTSPSQPRPFASGFRQSPLMCKREITLAGQAADFLRKFGAVYRCDENGLPNAKGEFWKRNFSVLSDDELVSRARRLGFVETEI